MSHVHITSGFSHSTGLEIALVNNSRAGDGVLAEAVAPDVNENAGVAGAVGARDLDACRELASFTSGNLDLLMMGEETVNIKIITRERRKMARRQKVGLT